MFDRRTCKAAWTQTAGRLTAEIKALHSGLATGTEQGQVFNPASGGQL